MKQSDNKDNNYVNNNYIWLFVVLVLVAGAIFYLESIKPAQKFSAQVSNSSQSVDQALKNLQYPKAPELAGISGYINADGNLTIASLKGKVVIVDFWTYSCINCLRTLPYLNAWYDKYHDQGLVIIGVHTPEFDFEKNYTNVEMAVQKYGVKYPVVLDNDYATWSAYQNQYWPRKYIIDKDGYIRFDHIGEGGYDETEKQIQELLLEIGENTTHSGTVNVTDTTPTTFNSPETYLGWQFAVPRGENIGGEGYKPDQNYTYSKPDASNLKDNIPYLENTWYNKEDSLVSFDGSVMYYKFTAKNANIVLEGNGTIQVYIDDALISSDVAGKDVMNGVISVDEPRLYEIYSGNYATHVLKLVFTKGIETHAFTFG